jgi:hypothetical protein
MARGHGVGEKGDRTLRGWVNCFRVGPIITAYRVIDAHTVARLPRWLHQRHKMHRCGFEAYPP